MGGTDHSHVASNDRPAIVSYHHAGDCEHLQLMVCMLSEGCLGGIVCLPAVLLDGDPSMSLGGRVMSGSGESLAR